MLTDVLFSQQRELQLRLTEPYVERRLLRPIRDNDLIKVVSGPRRAGKSFFAIHWLNELGRFGYANFDDDRLIELTDYDVLVAALDSVYGNPTHLLLDEIQNLPKWELFANRLQRQGRRLVLTGSNAHLLSSELATHLTGRHETIVIFPFSFAESLQRIEQPLTSTERAQAFRRYLGEGGFPEPLLKDIDRRSYLSALWDSVVYKDIVRRHRIRSVQGIDDLGRYLLSNAAHEYSSRKLAAVTRCRSVHTVQKYLRHLEEAFLLFSVARFSFKVRRQMRANRKVYCFDNGFAAAKGFQFSPNLGKLCENAVAVALKRKELAGLCEVYSWKGPRQEEVDFVVKQGVEITQLIQVCWELSTPQIRQREVRGLLSASRELHCRNLLVLTDTEETEEAVRWYGNEERVRYMPVWKWLLTDELPV